MTNQSCYVHGWLFTPATRPERFAKALAVSADVLIIDLEDAVAPADKDSARATALKYLAAPGEGGIARALRVNALDTAAGLEGNGGVRQNLAHRTEARWSGDHAVHRHPLPRH